MSDKVIRILSLKQLMLEISRVAPSMRRYPCRIVASPTQVSRWWSEIGDHPWADAKKNPDVCALSIMGIPVIAGAPDAAAEFIWAEPITEGDGR